MVAISPGRMLLLFALSSLPHLVASLFVVPSLSHIPAGVRAACRVTLTKNVTECSDEIQRPLEFISPSLLPDICTTKCANALSSLYTEATTRCGTDAVDITVNGTVTDTFTPLDLVGELRYKYNITCLQDMSPPPALTLKTLTPFYMTKASAGKGSRTFQKTNSAQNAI